MTSSGLSTTDLLLSAGLAERASNAHHVYVLAPCYIEGSLQRWS